MKTYEELITFASFPERLSYLSFVGKIGEFTFGAQRYLNQGFYRSRLWSKIRNEVILRDRGFDLGIVGLEILGPVIVHHMNPLTSYDIENLTPFLTDVRFLITTSKETHQRIHYGVNNQSEERVVRMPGDHILWRRRNG